MNLIEKNAVLVGILLSMTVASCGGMDAASTETEPESAPLSDRLKLLDHDLTEGSQGEDVRAVHDYLARFGYLPNADLARRFAAWRPLVAQGPASPTSFDENTTAAIRQLQAHARLPRTGIVDEATRAFLVMDRCGVPDGISRLDSSDKFATGSKFGGPITWKRTGTDTDDGVSLRTAAAAAVTSWANEMSLSMSETTGTATVNIFFDSSITQASGTLAFVQPPSPDIHVATWPSWSTSPNGTQYDLQSTITHEFGHSLGLFHSSWGPATMFPTINLGSTIMRSLDIDDQVATSTQYDQWTQPSSPIPFSAIDIGVGRDGGAWAVASNNRIWKSTGGAWTQDASGGFALRIAGAPDGRPWIVGTNGSIYRYTTSNPSTGSWQIQPGNGCATDIGVGGDSSAWIIGCGGAPDGSIFRFNGSGWTHDMSSGLAVRIAVGPTGVPWVVNSSGNIFRYSTSDPLTGNWGSAISGLALDIGISQTVANNNNYAWAIGTASMGNGDFSIHALEEQPDPFRGQWTQLAGGARQIAVGPKGEPWVANAGGLVWRTIK